MPCLYLMTVVSHVQIYQYNNVLKVSELLYNCLQTNRAQCLLICSVVKSYSNVTSSFAIVSPHVCSTVIAIPQLCSSVIVMSQLCSTVIVMSQLCSTVIVIPHVCSTVIVKLVMGVASCKVFLGHVIATDACSGCVN